jgi:hypothetical protein
VAFGSEKLNSVGVARLSGDGIADGRGETLLAVSVTATLAVVIVAATREPQRW